MVVGFPAPALCKGKVFVIVVVGMVLAVVASPSSGSFVEFWRRFEVGFLYGGIDCRRWLVDAEGELHALNGAWLRVLTRFSAAFLLFRPLADYFYRVAGLEIRGRELLNAPAAGW